MNRILLLSIAFLLCVSINGQVEWHQVSSLKAQGEAFQLKATSQQEQVVSFNLSEYGTNVVETPNGRELIFRLRKGAHLQERGAPDLDKITQSIVIHHSADTKIEVVSADYYELEGVTVAPSKGVLTRATNPQDVPYEYGEVYESDIFYPGQLADLSDAYNIRELRGQAISFYPFQYNPVTKTMRIYTNITVRVITLESEGKNPLPVLKSAQQIDPLFHSVYANHFLNYGALKYTPLQENGGKMLIICADEYASEMQAFVNYKTSIGLQVELVNYSTLGSASAIKSHVANYYNTNGLTYLLLVGDHAQVPTSSTSAGDSDNNYGYIVGNDHYLDVFVGRFSAENNTQVNTQVTRTLQYERDMAASNAIISKGVGIASNEGTGGGGDMGESDEQHMNNIENDLQNYGYAISRCYQNGGSTSQLSSLINSGTGLINYIGHGGVSNWVAPNFSSTNVNALTNNGKYPFVISVACVVGDFKTNTCFAESWLRATNNGTPTGALVFCGSTINQSWSSPMRAQDEMNDLLVANSFYSYGGMFVNGMFKMIDAYGDDGINMADTWTCFGDPSVQTRTPGHPDSPGDVSSCGVPTNLQTTDVTTTTANVSWNAVSGAQTYVLAYKLSTAANWTEKTVAGTSESFSGLTANTTYQVRVKTNCSEGSSGFSGVVSFKTADDGSGVYCSSKGNDASYEWIAGVKMGTYTHTSAGAGYTDFTDETVDLSANSTVNVELTPGFKSQSYTEYWKIFIDFNGDKDFEDAGEEVFSANGKTAVSGTITIPANVSGNTRMRIVMKYNGAPSPCGSYDYGETEDYTVSFSEPSIVYCDSQGNDSSYEWIAGVTVGNYTKNSGAAGYTDNTSEQIALQAGNNYGVTLTPGFKSSSYDEFWHIWIDLNANGSFDDAGELLYSGNGNAAVSGSMTIPSTASGETRMRVSMRYNNAPASCGSFDYGEVEDYTVNINRSRDLGDEVTKVAALKVYPNPTEGELYLDLTGIEGDVEISIIGISGTTVYQDVLVKPQGDYRHHMNVNHLSKGSYVVLVKHAGGLLSAHIVVK
ncbi:T9SS C-terminal target domain-containing protein [Marinilabiliaceae bacterium JC017]|nr:T9SS C-terminal target domain-containing protein [Marinilabiliaceae bacterium JC017]